MPASRAASMNRSDSAGSLRFIFSFGLRFGFSLTLGLPYSLSVVSRSIGQPLAGDALQGDIGACHIIYAEPDAIGIAEVEFCEITVKVFLAAMLVDADHVALEDREIALDRIRGSHMAFHPGTSQRWCSEHIPPCYH
jgi:hypothetical protein